MFVLHFPAVPQSYDWKYSRIQVDEPQLATFLDANALHYGGFSLTMPLKEELFRIAGQQNWQADEAARLLESANTLVVGENGQVSVRIGTAFTETRQLRVESSNE